MTTACGRIHRAGLAGFEGRSAGPHAEPGAAQCAALTFKPDPSMGAGHSPRAPWKPFRRPSVRSESERPVANRTERFANSGTKPLKCKGSAARLPDGARFEARASSQELRARGRNVCYRTDVASPDDLALADRRIADAQTRTARQRPLVRDASEASHETTDAATLPRMIGILASHARCRLIASELRRSGPPSP